MNICIIGFGRFGKLAAKMFSPFGKIFVVEKKKVSQRGVRQIGIEQLGEMDWVILAVPISELENILKKIKDFLKKGCLVMDVCSVKVRPCKWMQKQLGKDVEILGTHPMFGPDSAKYGLKGLQIIVCPLRISQERLGQVKNFFKKLDLKIIMTTPRDHDKQAAKSLSLVHYLGRVLGKMGIEKQQISSMGFERLLTVNETVTNDTWQLFFDMQQYNPYAKDVRKKFRKSCDDLEKMIGR
jgi:prephenate dehydrogenase